jgi:hypothetical protein
MANLNSPRGSWPVSPQGRSVSDPEGQIENLPLLAGTPKGGAVVGRTVPSAFESVAEEMCLMLGVNRTYDGYHQTDVTDHS